MSSAELTAEQEYLTLLHERLRELRQETEHQLADTLGQVSRGHQALAEREAAARRQARWLAALRAAEGDGLCFGRLDDLAGGRRYIGRLGLPAADPTADPLLVDWRAPAARPFYCATPVSPEGVRRRRHIRTVGRRVVALHDELLVLEPDAPSDGAPNTPAHSDGGAAAHVPAASGVTGEAALLAALASPRTGRMTDIVRTIQAEQDRIIRSDHRGVLVVEGGPGTGKTAVALHRAAYLLYTHRERLSRSAVLVVGPNPVFLAYIGDVLPSLGETGVLATTIGELYPGVRPGRGESAAAAEVKGRAEMAEVVAAAVRDRQWVPEDPLPVPFEDHTLLLDPDTVRDAQRRVRALRLPHNQARPHYHRLVVAALARQYAALIGTDPFDGELLLGEDDLAVIRDEIAADAGVRQVLEQLWPRLTPQQLLADLFASPDRLAAAAPGLTEAERALLLRPAEESAADGPWSASDVPLLDEAAELLGEDDRAARRAAERTRRVEERLAQEVLDIALGSRSTDLEDGEEAEVLSAYDVLDADRLAERYREADDRTAAERAAADRTWAFGHVVVDEAQELTPMDWRMLMRRCPSRSMTVVGDLAQTGARAGRPPGRRCWSRTRPAGGGWRGWRSTTGCPPRWPRSPRTCSPPSPRTGGRPARCARSACGRGAGGSPGNGSPPCCRTSSPQRPAG